MGCFHSTTNKYGQQVDFSVTKVLIAKRPGGKDVGPITTFEHICDESTQRVSEIKEGPVGTKTKLLPIGSISFSVVKVVADDNGVVFYHFSGSSAQDPTLQLHIAKRYTEFKMLHAEVSKLMVNERIVPVLTQQEFIGMQSALPEMPKADIGTCLRGRYHEQILEKREQQFTRILNAIARHPVAFQSTSFTTFLLD